MFHVKHTISSGIVSRETLDLVEDQIKNSRGQFGEYISKLLYWNKRVNLVSRDLSPDDLMLHVKHSLMIQYSSSWVNTGKHIIDAGSGGGLPGIPLAMATSNEYELVDVVEKKMMACRDIIRGLGLNNVKAKHRSIENDTGLNTLIYVSKHAFKLSDFIRMTEGQTYSSAIFLKGDDYLTELSECQIPLTLEVIRLSDYHSDSFYKGKNVITLINPYEKSRTEASDFTDASIQTKAH